MKSDQAKAIEWCREMSVIPTIPVIEGKEIRSLIYDTIANVHDVISAAISEIEAL